MCAKCSNMEDKDGETANISNSNHLETPYPMKKCNKIKVVVLRGVKS
jgi:hypothetical protein